MMLRTDNQGQQRLEDQNSLIREGVLTHTAYFNWAQWDDIEPMSKENGSAGRPRYRKFYNM
jgi:hypothetical protein